MPMDRSHSGGGGEKRGSRDTTRERSRPPLTVLIVDADGQRAQTIAEWLQPTCLVAIVPSARMAVSVVGQRTPDLIITDLDLPDMPGIDFVTHLAGVPATRHILRMVVTRRRSVRDKVDALRAGADEYIVWPCDREFLILHVRLLSRFRRLL